jgi:CRISPR-associated endonuclease/helicase Cas3
LLSDYQQQGPESLQGWLTGCWWLTAVPQRLVRFRAGAPQLPVYLALYNDEWKFVEKEKYGKLNLIEELCGIERDAELSSLENSRLWLHRDYETLLEELDTPSIERAALMYGEIGLPTYGKECHQLSFRYASQLGLVAK